MKFRVKDVHAVADDRLPGYVEAVMDAGVSDGVFVVVDDNVYTDILKRFTPAGDKLKAGLRPIVLFLDRHIGTDLENCLGCDDRRKRLNRAHIKMKELTARV